MEGADGDFLGWVVSWARESLRSQLRAALQRLIDEADPPPWLALTYAEVLPDRLRMLPIRAQSERDWVTQCRGAGEFWAHLTAECNGPHLILLRHDGQWTWSADSTLH